ncbi:MAG: DUF1365 domain-containing protein [Candidatus Thiodiazotropha lotti]|uniref:DUF1365 domain-containing protein n=1 Tax=Candidatus Thiodiazotropha endoloripes TaxID=1818881 RepID=UPI00083DCC8E|nr:DUF1365 domain-containing protein [Candidatus Thiodiazotropha endoloripes]MCG7914008.1 DUF1365 domain-containing protein [Candidatus Thiodiazotropha weberae]MCG7990209.1 DUF1365 domain-containing protein [Candidatus Thiodiazotropha lotti]MCG7999155.1 DUF1365 domain-containing protein [Candidatus Thiodiazotropha lotti]MCW4181862.1 DUF1365 domain-containing protein [Candidatus Thiodiazotropha weberae]MCW4190923.1 DUF1365 domain-containing protein [Candidatus Thiodiazotropha weberae]
MCDRQSRIYLTQVMHQRLFPVNYRFSYPVFSLLIDLNRIDEECRSLSLLSLDRFNLLSFNRKDHGPRDGSCLKNWATQLLVSQNIDIGNGSIKLLCFPRILGYAFNPISIWYCYHSDGSLKALICEVNNTFKEHHFYLIHNQGDKLSWPVNATKKKQFHVSPLISMNGEYHFSFHKPGKCIGVVIREYQNDRLMLTASQAGYSYPLIDSQLLYALVRTPLMTFKVVLAIHWQALKIWLRGAKFFPKPKPPKEQISI